MHLKHVGKTVLPSLLKPEEKLLRKAADLLDGLALLPCTAAEDASAASAAILRIIDKTRPTTDLPGQQRLPDDK